MGCIHICTGGGVDWDVYRSVTDGGVELDVYRYVEMEV